MEFQVVLEHDSRIFYIDAASAEQAIGQLASMSNHGAPLNARFLRPHDAYDLELSLRHRTTSPPYQLSEPN